MYIIQREGICHCTLSSRNQVTMSLVLIVIQTTIVSNLKLQIQLICTAIKTKDLCPQICSHQRGEVATSLYGEQG